MQIENKCVDVLLNHLDIFYFVEDTINIRDFIPYGLIFILTLSFVFLYISYDEILSTLIFK